MPSRPRWAGGILHLGATSMDIEDNADALRLRQSLDLVLERLRALLLDFAEKIEAYADLPLMAFTHLQPAEPSTLGYRLAQYAQDLLDGLGSAAGVREPTCAARASRARWAPARPMPSCSASGTAGASSKQRLSAQLELPFFPIATQVYPRKQDYQVVSAPWPGWAARCTSSPSTCACCSRRRWAS